MADLGFLPAVKRLLDATRPDGQRLLFSATLDGAVDGLAKRYLRNPVRHQVDSIDAPSPQMTHHVLHVERDARLPVLVDLASAPGRTLVFTRTRHGAKKLTQAASGGWDLGGRAAWRPLAGASHAEPVLVHPRTRADPGRHRHRRPRHPRRRRPARRARGPAGRAQGLHAQVRPHGPSRCERHGGHAGARRPALVGPQPHQASRHQPSIARIGADRPAALASSRPASGCSRACPPGRLRRTARRGVAPAGERARPAARRESTSYGVAPLGPRTAHVACVRSPANGRPRARRRPRRVRRPADVGGWRSAVSAPSSASPERICTRTCTPSWSQTVRSSGLMRRRYGYYWIRIVAAVLAFAGVWVVVPLLGNSWMQLVCRRSRSAWWSRSSGSSGTTARIGRSSPRRPGTTGPRGSCPALFVGLSYGWWRSKHNEHHAAPNQIGRDPDIAPGILAFTEESARSGPDGRPRCSVTRAGCCSRC